ncbi:MAG: hypothetical protein ACI9QL_004290, partial [Candidatus Omnitrophota bacterium]
ESLMNSFHGPGLSKMMIVTIVVHVVVILGTSVPFMLKSVLGENTSELSKDERIEKAVADATSSLQKIADEHGLSPKEISDQFGTGKTMKPVERAKPSTEPEAPATSAQEPEKPKSAIEQALEKKAPGPGLPDVSSDIEEEEDDLFK